MVDETSPAGLSDEELDAALAALDETDETGEQGAEAEGETDAAPPADQQAQETDGATDAAGAKPEGWNPDGPGDVKVALKQTRDELRAIKAEADELRQWRHDLLAQQQQAQAQREEAQRQADRREQWENTFDDDERLRLQEHWRQEDASRVQSEAQQRYVTSVFAQSWEMASQTIPDFVTQMQKAAADPAMAAAIEAAAMQAIRENKSPALAAFNLAKSFRSDAEIDAEVEKRLASRLKEVLQKQQKPSTAGVTTIAHASSAVPGAPGAKSPRALSDAELDRRLRGE